MESAPKPSDEAITLHVPDDLAQDTKSKLKEILDPIFGEAGPLCEQARGIVVNDVADADGMKKARDIRLALRKIRTNSEKHRKDLKDDALRTGRAIDDIFRPLRNAIEAHEAYLTDQETYAQRVADERRRRVVAERSDKIREAGGDPGMYKLDEVSQDEFDTLLAGVVAQVKAKREADEAAEAERLEQEKADAAERERIEKENQQLREQAEAERQRAADLQAAEDQRLADEKAERERQEEKDRQAAAAPDKDKLGTVLQQIRDIDVPDCGTELGQPAADRIRDVIAECYAKIADILDEL